MQLLESWSLKHGGKIRHIELFQGDLASLPAEHAVDILTVSALPNDYSPTRGSLIGALARNGILVADLAASKQLDMREEFSCWLSQPLENAAFRQLLCIESGWRGSPPEIVDDLFRALAPLFITTFPEGSVALPILGTGDQGYPEDVMIESILRAAASWIARGLAINCMKIVVSRADSAARAKRAFADFRHREVLSRVANSGLRDSVAPGLPTPPSFDLFVGYSHEDAAPAQVLVNSVKQRLPGARIFHDRTLAPGSTWLMEIAESLDGSRRVAALFTPHYWASRFCTIEFSAALARQVDQNQTVLFPIYYRSAAIPYLFRNLQFADCREADAARLDQASDELSQSLSQASCP